MIYGINIRTYIYIYMYTFILTISYYKLLWLMIVFSCLLRELYFQAWDDESHTRRVSFSHLLPQRLGAKAVDLGEGATLELQMPRGGDSADKAEWSTVNRMKGKWWKWWKMKGNERKWKEKGKEKWKESAMKMEGNERKMKKNGRNMERMQKKMIEKKKKIEGKLKEMKGTWMENTGKKKTKGKWKEWEGTWKEYRRKIACKETEENEEKWMEMKETSKENEGK